MSFCFVNRVSADRAFACSKPLAPIQQACTSSKERPCQGYGDYVPKNWLSKAVGSIAMVSGMLIIATPLTTDCPTISKPTGVCRSGSGAATQNMIEHFSIRITVSQCNCKQTSKRNFNSTRPPKGAADAGLGICIIGCYLIPDT